MRKILRIIFFLVLTVHFSCEEQGLFVWCSDCTAEEPLSASLEMKLTQFYNLTTTVIKVYEGNLEDSIIYKTLVTTAAKAFITVPINKNYTITASYYSSGNKYCAVDSALPRVKYDKDNCNDPCYFIFDRFLDLRLKYTK